MWRTPRGPDVGAVYGAAGVGENAERLHVHPPQHGWVEKVSRRAGKKNLRERVCASGKVGGPPRIARTAVRGGDGSLSSWRSLRRRTRWSLLMLGTFVLAIGLSLFWEGPRTVYSHAVIVCLDCIGLV